MTSRLLGSLAAALACIGCQGPPEPKTDVRPHGEPTVALAATLEPLARAFEEHAAVPRIVALMPARCSACPGVGDALRRGVLEAFPGADLHVFVVARDVESCERCGRLAAPFSADPRVSVFTDPEARAARAFARGLLPLAEAREVFLFYAAGARWTDDPAPLAAPPRAEDWWHRMGRIAPERYCTHDELEATLRATMSKLLEAAEAPVTRRGA